MKKIIFVFILLMLPTVIQADDATIPVILSPGASNGGKHGRSTVYLPEVNYSMSRNSLSIEFESADSYVLEVEDINGINWYSGPVNTSGSPTVYYVNLQSNNTYYITISSDNDSFYGILML